jgi:hypothetical protein
MAIEIEWQEQANLNSYGMIAFCGLTSEKHLCLTRPASTVSLQCHEID